MTTHQDQIPDHHAFAADAPGAIRPLSPGILALALLLALTASVATAGVIEGSDPARLDRREAPRELTVRWLSSAVAKAARDLASNEVKAGAVSPTISVSLLTTTPVSAPRAIPRTDACPTIPDGWPAQGLLNVPPPTAL